MNPLTQALRARAGGVVLYGTPLVLDIALRPFARMAQVGLGLVLTALTWWLAGWWWAPVPLAASFVLYELVFWWRGDRPVLVSLGEQLKMIDRLGERTLTVDPGSVDAATIYRRRRSDDRDEVVVVLSSRSSILLGLRLLVEPDVPAAPSDVPVARLDELLGGLAGLLRSTTPLASRCRQTIDDPRGQALAWLRAKVSPQAFERTGVRLWTGAAPPLDAFAHHVGEHDAMLTIDGDTWELRQPQSDAVQGVLTFAQVGHAERWVTLASRPEHLTKLQAMDEIPGEEMALPLSVVTLADNLTIVLPAPALQGMGAAREADPTWQHTHVAEGGALLWHLLRRWPPTAWPSALRSRALDVIEGATAPSSDSPHGMARSE